MGYLGRVGLTHKKLDQVTSQLVFVSGQKNGVRIMVFSGRVWSANSDQFCHV